MLNKISESESESNIVPGWSEYVKIAPLSRQGCSMVVEVEQ